VLILAVVHNYDDSQCVEYVGLYNFIFLKFAKFVSFVDELVWFF
jgi:hypothetical protein